MEIENSPREDQGPPKILIAEDDEAFRKLLIKRAENLGVSVSPAADGRKALRAVQNERFDVLIVDLVMPGPSGIQVFQAGREHDPLLQAIVITAQATLESAVEALRAGVYDFLIKPLESLAVFEWALARALEYRRLLNENQRLVTRLERLAKTDPLTGLYNRRLIDETMDIEIERARRYDRPLSVIMIDVDNLKHINDARGHLAGDEILQRVAQAIRRQIRKVDLPVRFGGDEFLVLLPEASLERAGAVAERIAQALIQLSKAGEPVTFSAGVAEWHPDRSSSDSLLEAADAALFAAKHEGRGCIASTEGFINKPK